MKKPLAYILTVLIAAFFLLGCSAKTVSTGFLNQPEKRGETPAGLPATITIVPFEGEARGGKNVEDLIAKRLYLLGYDIIPYEELLELALPDQFHSFDFTCDDNRVFLSQKYGLEGIVTGKYTVVSKVTKAAAHLEVNLIDVAKGRPLWRGESDDNSWPVTVTKEKKAVDQLVAGLMKSLKKDLKRYSKIERKKADKAAKENAIQTADEPVTEPAYETIEETVAESAAEPADSTSNENADTMIDETVAQSADSTGKTADEPVVEPAGE
ncbi:hypothetical protein K9N50_09745 [bacterium]|nr:hypothetical protein [bacterium]